MPLHERCLAKYKKIFKNINVVKTFLVILLFYSIFIMDKCFHFFNAYQHFFNRSQIGLLQLPELLEYCFILHWDKSWE